MTRESWSTEELAVLGTMCFCSIYRRYVSSVKDIALTAFGRSDSLAKSRVNRVLAKLRSKGWLFIDQASHREYGARMQYGLRCNVEKEVLDLLDDHDLPELPLKLSE